MSKAEPACLHQVAEAVGTKMELTFIPRCSLQGNTFYKWPVPKFLLGRESIRWPLKYFSFFPAVFLWVFAVTGGKEL